MPDETKGLGGRLPLLERGGLSGAQAALWDKMDAAVTPWARKTGFECKSPDGEFIGPFNGLLRSPKIAEVVLQFQLGEMKESSLPARLREVVILSVAAAWKPTYEIYAHSIAAKELGFSDDCVASLNAGVPHEELTAQETIAQRFALSLSTNHEVDDQLYSEAEDQFGEQGLVDLAVLAGGYYLVSSVLNIFSVPAPPARS